MTADPKIKEMHWLWSPGGGKTTGLEGAFQWRMANRPSNILLVGQKEETAKRWAETRFVPSVKKNIVLKPLLPTDGQAARQQIRKNSIIFNHGFYIEMGGSSESNLQEKSMPMVAIDEAWKVAEHPGRIQQAKQRTHDKYNALILFTGQAGPTHQNPDDDDTLTDLYREWRRTDQRTFSFECECCGLVQPWKWDQLQFDLQKIDDTEEIDWNATAETVHLKCSNPDCDEVWQDSITDRRKLADSGRYIVTNDNAETGYVGFHANAMCYWRIPWLKLVKQFVTANEAKMKGDLTLLQVFIQQRLCEFWTPQKYEVEHELTPGGYMLKDVRDGDLVDHEAARCLTVDVQQNSLWYLVSAWTTEGKMHVLECGELLTFEELFQVQQRMQVKKQCVMVDCGYRQDFVFQTCNKYGWTAFKGSGTQPDFPVNIKGKIVRMPYSRPRTVESDNGKKCIVIHLAVNTIKDVLADMRAGRVGEFVTPDDLSETYNNHLNAEVKRRTVVGRERREQDIWVRIGHRDNHLLDCTMAAVAFGMMKRYVRINELDTGGDE